MTERRSRPPHSHAARDHPRLPDKNVLEDAAVLFAALGDPPRLRLLMRLARCELCVSELVELENEKVSTVSARLKLLYGAQLVKRRRDAKHIYYSLTDSHIENLIANAIEHASEHR